MAGEPAFFELGVQDDEKGRAFYSALFGWDFTPGPNEGYEIRTAGIPGGIHGGDAGASPYLFFAVDDMDAAVERVRELGGEVIDTDIEGDPNQQAKTGRFKLCRDDQGSAFGLPQRP
jgi:predicted enzyme related to lactoylglutathione lyase